MGDSALSLAEPAAAAPDPVVPVPRAHLPLPFALLLAAAGGLALAASFPGPGWWPLAPVAVAALLLATRGHRARTAAALGWVFGMACFVPHLHWSGIYVGPVPWLALAGVESLYLAAMAAAFPRAWRVRVGRFTTVPVALAVACLWVAQEAVRGRWPFGGFPWGRLAFAQVDAPAAGLAALAGAPAVTAATAAGGAALALLLVRLRRPRTSLAPLVLALVVLLVGLAVPRPTAGPTARVAAVQGDVPEPGLEFNAERRAVLDNHVAGTRALAERVAAGTSPRPELVIWPENSSDIDPLRNDDAAAVIDGAARAVGVPVLIGAVLQEPVGHVSNAAILWSPATGPGPRYVKQHPAPFAEYIPFRSIARVFSDKVDLVQLDFTKGTTTGLFRVGRIALGDVICFEVAYDGLVQDPVRQGANLLAVQTNNATFGYSDESVQQLAMSRLRAIETGRSVVHISTVGISAIIRPDGSVVRRSGHFTPDVLESDVTLRTSLTPAVRLGAWPEWLMIAVGVLLVSAGAAGTSTRVGRGWTRRARRGAGGTEQQEEPGA
jgi:apolipoprotein N-acyltransferase